MPVNLGVDSKVSDVTKRYAVGFRKRVEDVLEGAFRSDLTQLGAGALATSEATVLAPGQLIEFAGVVVPPGFLECNGAEVSTTTYASLYAAIGDAYGSAESAGMFRLPNLQGAAAMGAGGTRVAGPGVSVASTHPTDAVSLEASNLPAHAHAVSRTSTSSGSHTHTWTVLSNLSFNSGRAGDSVANHWGTPGFGYGEAVDDAPCPSGGRHTHGVGGDITAFGGGVAMNVQQPSLSVLMLIKT